MTTEDRIQYETIVIPEKQVRVRTVPIVVSEEDSSVCHQHCPFLTDGGPLDIIVDHYCRLDRKPVVDLLGGKYLRTGACLSQEQEP